MNPWCSQCGDWKGYTRPLCAGCLKINDKLNSLYEAGSEEEMKEFKRLVDLRRNAVGVYRTNREMYTKQLEEFVSSQIDSLKTISFKWGQIKALAKNARLDPMYAQEVAEAMELALNELQQKTKELVRFTENKEAAAEVEQRIKAWRETLTKFMNPVSIETPEGSGE